MQVKYHLPMKRRMNKKEELWVKSHPIGWKLNNIKRKTCKACGTGNKAHFTCSVCKNGTCPEHSTLICNSCE